MRNISRSQPSAAQLSGAGSFLSSRSSSPHIPTPADPAPQNDAYRANYKPDFLQKPSSPSLTSQPTEPTKPVSITAQYDLARQQLTSAAPIQGNATEKQRRDYAWQLRNDPLKAREIAEDYQRIYQRGPAPSSTPPTRPTNFNGPRGRFST